VLCSQPSSALFHQHNFPLQNTRFESTDCTGIGKVRSNAWASEQEISRVTIVSTHRRARLPSDVLARMRRTICEKWRETEQHSRLFESQQKFYAGERWEKISKPT